MSTEYRPGTVLPMYIKVAKEESVFLLAEQQRNRIVIKRILRDRARRLPWWQLLGKAYQNKKELRKAVLTFNRETDELVGQVSLKPSGVSEVLKYAATLGESCVLEPFDVLIDENDVVKVRWSNGKELTLSMDDCVVV